MIDDTYDPNMLDFILTVGPPSSAVVLMCIAHATCYQWTRSSEHEVVNLFENSAPKPESIVTWIGCQSSRLCSRLVIDVEKS